MEPTLQELEAARARRNYMLLAAVALLLIIPLVVAAYLRMTDTTVSGTPGTKMMEVFEKREGRGPIQPSPMVTAPPIAKQDSLAKPVVMDFGTETSSPTSSLGFVAGGGDPQAKAQPAAPAQPQPQPEQNVGLEAVNPKAQAPVKKSWSPPKLGTRQSGLKPVSWSTDKGGKLGTPAQLQGTPAGQQGAATPGGMPAGMDPGAMMKNMMPGVDLSKMMQGGTNPATGTTNPTGTK